jgi:PAS domain S-box-containing protein
MRYLLDSLNSFINLGIESEPDPSKRSYIQYYNFDLLGYLAFAVLAIPIVYLMPPEIRLFLHELSFLYVLLISMCLYLNGRGYHVLSSVIINLGLLTAVAVVDLRVGGESHVYLFIISVCMTPLFMLHQHKWLSYTMMGIGIALFIILSNEVVSLSDAPYGSPQIISFFRTAVNVLIIPVTTVRFLYIFRINDEYIARQEEQRRYLRQVIDLNPNFIFAKNRKGEFTLVNEALARTYGTTVNELLGKTDGDFNPNHAEVEHFRRDDLDVMDLKVVKFVPLEEITDISTGAKKYLQTVKTPLEDDSGRATQILGVATDITDRIVVQKEMQLMQEALSQKNIQMEKYIESNLQLENFAYIASHDLREPLRSIIGYSQLLERRYAHILDSDGREYIAHLISSTKSMNNLITDLLLFSRVNTESIHYQKVRLPEVIAQVKDNLRSVIDDTQADIQWHDMPETIQADRTRLIQLFQNLIGNAIKFHQPGEPPQVSVQYRPLPGEHQFEVRDDGIGIEPQYQERIFHIFHRLHNRSEYEGSGIGLATCQKIVEQHHGTIRVESAPGLGSSFIFTIGAGLQG